MWFVLVLSIIGSSADMVGGAFTVFKRYNSVQVYVITALGAGFLLGATLLDRLPDAFTELPTSAALYITIGFLALLVLERNHVHVAPDSSNDLHHTHQHGFVVHPRVAFASFLGLLFHTFMDGVIIAGSFSISRATGILMFVAIALHKVPEGFSMATITLASGKSRTRAFMTSAALAGSTMVGALLTMEVGTINVYVVKILMSLATGSFLYVSAADLVPAVRNRSAWAIVAVIVGVGAFYGSLILVKHVGLH